MDKQKLPSSLDHIAGETFAVPILNVASVKRSLAYYTEILGFSIQWEWGDPVDFACVSLGKSEVFLGENGQGQSGTWFYLFMENVEEYQAQLDKRKGVKFKSRCEIKPWKMLEMHLEDPDGHIIRVGTSSCED